MSQPTRLPVLAISHGGGPCFFMDWPPPFEPQMWKPLETYLRAAGREVAPWTRAILVISAHWDAAVPTVTTGDHHSLYYDYYGFPESTYALQYPARGDPGLAARVRALLANAGIASGEDDVRGLDHGVFVPFLIMFPDADIPIVQLSLRSDMDPAAHLAMGRALAPLRGEGVLIVGSGNSYHNMREGARPGVGDAGAAQFDAWLGAVMGDADDARRSAALTAWNGAPCALKCHPTPEHLLPYHVAAGAADGDVGTPAFRDDILGKATSGYRFG